MVSLILHAFLLSVTVAQKLSSGENEMFINPLLKNDSQKPSFGTYLKLDNTPPFVLPNGPEVNSHLQRSPNFTAQAGRISIEGNRVVMERPDPIAYFIRLMVKTRRCWFWDLTIYERDDFEGGGYYDFGENITFHIAFNPKFYVIVLPLRNNEAKVWLVRRFMSPDLHKCFQKIKDSNPECLQLHRCRTAIAKPEI